MNYEVIDGDYENIEHEMSGYMGAYNTLRVDTEIRKYENGKFRAYVEEQMYCGDFEDRYEFYECDKEIRNNHESPEFDTEKEAWDWVENNEDIDWQAE